MAGWGWGWGWGLNDASLQPAQQKGGPPEGSLFDLNKGYRACEQQGWGGGLRLGAQKASIWPLCSQGSPQSCGWTRWEGPVCCG